MIAKYVTLAMVAGGLITRGVEAQAVRSRPFDVTVKDVRTVIRAHRFAVVTLRFHNPTRQPVTLAYVQNSARLVDERANAWELEYPVRGLGEIAPGSYDPRFTLGPGQSADARLQFSWAPGQQGGIFGLTYQLAVSVRQLLPVPGNQFRIGAEFPVLFEKLQDSAPSASPDRVTPDSACGGREACSAARRFVAEITRVMTSKASNDLFVLVSVRFTNTDTMPLVLCYAAGSAVGGDERANRYDVRGAAGVRGIGSCSQGVLDGQFVLAPSQAREATFEYATSAMRPGMLGTRLTAALMSVAELHPLPGNQIELVREIPLTFLNLAEAGLPAQASAPKAGPPAPVSEAAGPAIQPDACAGKPQCYFAGPFLTEVTDLSLSKASGYQFVKLGLRLRNLSSDTLVLCYSSATAVGTDDRQNRYAVRNDRVLGLGVCAGGTANPRFTLAPGQSRAASLEYDTGIYAETILGTAFNLVFTVEQLEILPGNQIVHGADYVVSFTDLHGQKGSGGKKGGLLDRITKAIKPR